MTDFSKTHIQFRRGSQAEFNSVNPILGSGEPAFAVDTNSFKIGNGTTAWSSLPSTIRSDTTGIAGASGVYNLVYISSGDYNALGSYDPNTIYFIR
jgi:hypothetical protein